MNTKSLTAEFIGTFALIFIGAGAGALGVGGLVGVALAHGLVIVGFAYTYGHISGTHVNPAITFGLWVAGEIPLTKAAGYWAAQFAGATAAAVALRFVLGAESGLGATLLAPGVTVAQGIVVEAILTFFLANAVFNTAVSGKAGNLAGVAIGLTLTFTILMGGPLTGASLNPARTFGPALLTGNLSQLWIYFAGPLAGAAGAALLYRNVFK